MVEQAFTVDIQIFSVQMEDFVTELAHHPLIVDHLQGQVQGVQVLPKVVIRDDHSHLAPDRRWASQVVAARPFILEEDHLEVLDGNLDPCSLAHWTMGGQILAKSSRFCGTVLSLPTNVPTISTSSMAAASMTLSDG
jgi:hypothetical protein